MIIQCLGVTEVSCIFDRGCQWGIWQQQGRGKGRGWNVSVLNVSIAGHMVWLDWICAYIMRTSLYEYLHFGNELRFLGNMMTWRTSAILCNTFYLTGRSCLTISLLQNALIIPYNRSFFLIDGHGCEHVWMPASCIPHICFDCFDKIHWEKGEKNWWMKLHYTYKIKSDH